MTASTGTTKRGASSSLGAWRQSKKARFRIILAFKYLIAAIVLAGGNVIAPAVNRILKTANHGKADGSQARG